MSGSHSRTKGHSFEREVAAKFREALPGCDARRGLQYRDGADCPDVTGIPGMHVECKRGARTNIKAGMRQAIDDMKDGMMPVVISRDDRASAMATMLFDDFLDLLRENWELNRR